MALTTYLQDNLKENRILRWPENCFPLKVYIAPFRWYARNNTDAYRYNALVRRALEAWEKASNGKITFKVVQTLNDSQINLDWKRVDRKALGHCYFHFDNKNRLYSAEIQIGLSDGILYEEYQDENEVYHTILHEVGHSLGLGHSFDEADIMYTPHRYGVINISPRDTLSLFWLYKLPLGISVQELAQKYGINSDNIDYIISQISNTSAKGKKSEFEEVKNSVKMPQKDLMSEQDKLAEIKKYNIGLQNIQISSNVQDYIKKNIIMKNNKKPKKY